MLEPVVIFCSQLMSDVFDGSVEFVWVFYGPEVAVHPPFLDRGVAKLPEEGGGDTEAENRALFKHQTKPQHCQSPLLSVFHHFIFFIAFFPLTSG